MSLLRKVHKCYCICLVSIWWREYWQRTIGWGSSISFSCTVHCCLFNLMLYNAIRIIKHEASHKKTCIFSYINTLPIMRKQWSTPFYPPLHYVIYDWSHNWKNARTQLQIQYYYYYVTIKCCKYIVNVLPQQQVFLLLIHISVPLVFLPQSCICHPLAEFWGAMGVQGRSG